MTRLCHLLAAIAAGLLLGCQADITELNEDNPAFQRGIEHYEAQRYAEAVAAFEECLKFAPGSYKAHLHIANLCVDHLDDLPRAIVHYQAYLRTAPKDESQETVRGYLENARRAYYEQLDAEFGVSVARPADTRPPVVGAGPTKPPALPAPAVQVPPPTAPEPRIHTVQKGDTLSSIARHYYGDPERWREIHEANRQQLSSPDALKLGMKLTIPPGE